MSWLLSFHHLTTKFQVFGNNDAFVKIDFTSLSTWSWNFYWVYRKQSEVVLLENSSILSFSEKCWLVKEIIFNKVVGFYHILYTKIFANNILPSSSIQLTSSLIYSAQLIFLLLIFLPFQNQVQEKETLQIILNWYNVVIKCCDKFNRIKKYVFLHI